MFRKDRIPPYNELAHLLPNTMSFVTLLRKSHRGDTDQTVQTVEANNNPGTKGKGRTNPSRTQCLLKSCLDVEAQCLQENMERDKLLEEFEQFMIDDSDVDYALSDTHTTLQQLNSEQNLLEKQLKLLANNEDEIHAKSKTIHSNSRQLEQQIRKAEKELRLLVEDDDQKLRNDTDSIDADVVLSSTRRSPGDQGRHSGVFGVGRGGVRMWSCCLSELRSCAGCGDDDSCRSGLVVKNKEQYRPFSSYRNNLVLPRQEFSTSSHVHSYTAPPDGAAAERERERGGAERGSATLSRMMHSRSAGSMGHSTASCGGATALSRSALSSGPQHRSVSPSVASRQADTRRRPTSANCTPVRQSRLQTQQQFPPLSPGSGANTSFFSDSNTFNNNNHNDLNINNSSSRILKASMTVSFATSQSYQDAAQSPGAHSTNLRNAANSLCDGTPTGVPRISSLQRIDRPRGRPLTAQSGPHLLMATTTAPSTCLSHLTARIV